MQIREEPTLCYSSGFKYYPVPETATREFAVGIENIAGQQVKIADHHRTLSSSF